MKTGTTILEKLKKEIENTQVVAPIGGIGSRSIPPEIIATLQEKNVDVSKGISSPKHLLKVGGKPLIDWFIDLYASNGFKELVFLLGKKENDKINSKIREYLGDGSHYNIHIRYSYDPEVPKVGKGKAFKNALLNGAIDRKKRCIVGYPDDLILYKSAPLELMSRHLYYRSKYPHILVTILVVPYIYSPYGMVKIDGPFIREFREKPRINQPANTGVFVMEPGGYRYVCDLIDIHSPEAQEIEDTVFPVLAKEGRIAYHMLPEGEGEVWIPVNTYKEWKKANKLIEKYINS